MARGNQETTKTTLARTRSRKAGAFTLVELLVVIGILAVLASLITGVTVYVMDKANREQTLSNQQVIINAVDRYYEIMGSYPPDDTVGNNVDKIILATIPTDPNEASGFILLHFLAFPTDSIETDELSARLQARMAKINKSSAAVLLELPEDAMDPAGFKDAYGNYMSYDMTGGLGGTPVVISPGPDGKFSAVADDGLDEDNIRSDNR